MVGVTTVALVERKPGISRDLFTRYWRDVHGVMAARIPGFESYTQHHVTPARRGSERFEGIAIVTFADEEDRRGLATSPMAAHIHRDETNVFRRALLYNLSSNAWTIEIDGRGREGATVFCVLPLGGEVGQAIAALRGASPIHLATYDLTTGDPAGWNDTDVDEGGRSRRFGTLIETRWRSVDEGRSAASALSDDAAVYSVDETHVMVENGRATPVGLRGFDAVATIREAAADNQLEAEVERALFGI